MPYPGPERRIHTVYVTRNSEYHVRAEVCIAVRSRAQHDWTRDHPALGRKMEGSLRFHSDGVQPVPGRPAIGDAIYFRRDDRDLITSRIERVERPVRDVVVTYP